jgi:hypothetical protein
VAASTNPASPAISPASSIVTKSSTACSAGDVSASTSGDWIYLFLKIALGIELFEIRPQVLGRLFVLNPSEYHFGARNFRFRILDVFLESRRLPRRTNREHAAAGVKPESASFALPFEAPLKIKKNPPNFEGFLVSCLGCRSFGPFWLRYHYRLRLQT